MKIARLSTLLGATLLTLAALIVPVRKAYAEETYCAKTMCCVWQGNTLVGCYPL